MAKQFSLNGAVSEWRIALALISNGTAKFLRGLNVALVVAGLGFSSVLLGADNPKGPKPQYKHQDIEIAAPSATEPVRPELSIERAEQYLRDGAVAWKGSKGCISCHTTGLYQTIRPSLTPHLGKPLDEMRAFFVEELRSFQASKSEELQKSTKPAQVIYLAAGLAEWDAHVQKTLSPETTEALALMFAIQRDNGTWGSLDCWPPFESDAFHLATVAAQAAAPAPGWLKNLKESPQLAGVTRLRQYLRETAPPHDYGRTLLLWAAARMPDLLPATRKAELLSMLRKHQQTDGGWSIRTFSEPEKWGGGNRAAKLRDEPNFATPASDGHMTGLALIVLREAGIPATDPALQRGVQWLKTNQRESGRWWTRSLNTDTYHYITYSGTAYPLLALGLCQALPRR
jgi:squalene-hopene/tetraprenyl-beta-curcumene cyclase